MILIVKKVKIQEVVLANNFLTQNKKCHKINQLYSLFCSSLTFKPVTQVIAKKKIHQQIFSLKFSTYSHCTVKEYKYRHLLIKPSENFRYWILCLNDTNTEMCLTTVLLFLYGHKMGATKLNYKFKLNINIFINQYKTIYSGLQVFEFVTNTRTISTTTILNKIHSA